MDFSSVHYLMVLKGASRYISLMLPDWMQSSTSFVSNVKKVDDRRRTVWQLCTKSESTTTNKRPYLTICRMLEQICCRFEILFIKLFRTIYHLDHGTLQLNAPKYFPIVFYHPDVFVNQYLEDKYCQLSEMPLSCFSLLKLILANCIVYNCLKL